jgi:hypothetical protein
MREGRFCAILFQTARKSLILKRRDGGVVDRARLGKQEPSDLCPPTSTLRHPSDSNRRAGGKEIRRSLLESRNLPTSHLCPPTSTLRPPSDSNRRAGGKEIRRFLFGKQEPSDLSLLSSNLHPPTFERQQQESRRQGDQEVSIWKLLWRSATACCRFRLLLRSQPLSGDRVKSVDHPARSAEGHRSQRHDRQPTS